MVQGIGSNFTDPQVRLQDATINQPQAFVASNEKPAAAAGVQGDSFEGKKKGKGGKIVGALVAVAAAAVALVFGAKYSTKIKEHLPVFIKKSEFANNCLHGLKVAGDWITTKATSLYGRAAEFVQNLRKPAQEAAQGAADAAQQV